MNQRRRVFDCCLFNGEMDVLAIRFHELNDVVDRFVIVEGNITFSGVPRKISFDPSDPRLREFSAKVRHVVVADMPETTEPRSREVWQRNAVLRGAPDAAPTDLLVLSDVDEIPRCSVVVQAVDDHESDVFGFRLALSCFYVNYRNVTGSETALTSAVAATRRQLDCITPDALRHAVRDGRVPARIFDNGGWHFSYLMDEAGIRQKIAASSHQELNNANVLKNIDINRLVREERNLLNRPGYQWRVLPNADVPSWLRQNRKQLRHLFCPVSLTERLRIALRRPWISSFPAARRRSMPVIICPYLYPHEAEEIRLKFGLDRPHGRSIEFFLWQDKNRIGPERAFEHCWNEFPDRDIIIIHSDMSPMPGEHAMAWYEALSAFRDNTLGVGMLACNLFFPRATRESPVRVQCAGGFFRDGKIGHLHGILTENPDEPGGVSSKMLSQVRPVDWVTFGGMLILREVIRACGCFDPRYKWAYFMDVDYSFEARLRGFKLLQVPVSLQHEENRTTSSLWKEEPELFDHIKYNMDRFYEKWAPFHPALTGFATDPRTSNCDSRAGQSK
jgi:Glycosyltransferase family 17